MFIMSANNYSMQLNMLHKAVVCKMTK